MNKQIKPHEPEAELLGPEDVAKDIASLEQALARRRAKLDEDVLDDVLLLQHPAIRETIRTSEANLAAGRYQTVDALLEKYGHELSD